MSIDARERALLRLVADRRDAECREILDAARVEVARALARAYAQERARLHERVQAERSAARARIQTARAERDARERAGGDRARAALLAQAWPRLRAELQARWADPAGRAAWVASALAQARRSLPPGVWVLRHAPDWPEAERAAAADDLARALETAPLVEPDPGLPAGLRIGCGGAVLDASLDGLLADRPRIESRLLALLAAEAAGAPEGLPAPRPEPGPSPPPDPATPAPAPSLEPAPGPDS